MKLKTKLTSLLLALAMLLALAGSASAAYLGDIDRDGKVRSGDARTALRAAAKLETLTDEQTRFGDVNGNGRIDAGDARIILRMAANLEALITIDESGTTTPTNPVDYPTTTLTAELEAIKEQYVCDFCGGKNGNHSSDCENRQGYWEEPVYEDGILISLIRHEPDQCAICGGYGGAHYEECPYYDIHRDCRYYCQTCGMPVGFGPDKCTRFLSPCNCPNCGQHVDSMTCHHCPKGE